MLGDFCFCFSQVLRNAVLFLILAPYDNEQSDLIHRVSEEKTLDEIHLYRYSLNPLTPGHFAKKCLSKRVKPFFGRCLAEKNPNCPKRCLQVEHWTSFCS